MSDATRWADLVLAGHALIGVAVFGLPSCLPCVLASCRPAMTRSRSRPLSNSANAESRWSINLPDADLADIYAYLQSIPKPADAASIPLLQP